MKSNALTIYEFHQNQTKPNFLFTQFLVVSGPSLTHSKKSYFKLLFFTFFFFIVTFDLALMQALPFDSQLTFLKRNVVHGGRAGELQGALLDLCIPVKHVLRLQHPPLVLPAIIVGVGSWADVLILAGV